MALGFCNIVLVLYGGLFKVALTAPSPVVAMVILLTPFVAFLILTVLKVFMAYQCESHLWNSLTGCVPLSAVANATNTTADVAGNATAAASKALGLPTLFT